MKQRLAIISKIVQGKSVLDVGCVDHEAAKETGDEWLHKVILEHASSVLGLDYAEEEVKDLVQKGYNIVYGNAEEVELGKKFDVVVAGELIEHLSNPGKFLENMRKHLHENGEIVLTTPNPYYPKRMAEILIQGRAQVHPQHVMWYCPRTLTEILTRAGFSEVKIIPFNNTERWSGVVNSLTRFRPWFSTNLLAVAKNAAR